MVLTQSANTVEATKLAMAEIGGLTHSRSRTKSWRGQGQHSELVPVSLRHQGKVLAERVRLEFYGYRQIIWRRTRRRSKR